MNRPVRAIAVFCGVLMLALLVRANWLQYVNAEELASDTHNRRVLIERFAAPRGDIIVGGEAVTGAEAVAGRELKFKRTYVNGPMYAPVTGFASQAQGMSLLEKTYDGILSGQDDRLAFQHFLDVATGKERGTGSVVTTIDPRAQKAAYKGLTGLKGARGAVVALDPKTGKVLALASAPSYDPSVFAGNTFKESDRFLALDKDKGKPLANRPLRETYPPGSTFKILTAAAALEHGVVSDIDAPSGAVSPTRCPSRRTGSAARPATRPAATLP